LSSGKIGSEQASRIAEMQNIAEKNTDIFCK